MAPLQRWKKSQTMFRFLMSVMKVERVKRVADGARNTCWFGASHKVNKWSIRHLIRN